jgi:hypothetical protein
VTALKHLEHERVFPESPCDKTLLLMTQLDSHVCRDPTLGDVMSPFATHHKGFIVHSTAVFHAAVTSLTNCIDTQLRIIRKPSLTQSTSTPSASKIKLRQNAYVVLQSTVDLSYNAVKGTEYFVSS